MRIATPRAPNRRDAIAMLGGAIAAGRVGSVPAKTESPPDELLAEIATDILRESPESATFLGVDKDALAGLRNRLTDRTIAGVEHLRRGCNDRLHRLRSTDLREASPQACVSLQAVLAAHELAAEGYDFAFGDNFTLGAGLPGSNSPYALSQSTGFFATIPDFLDSQHRIERRDDADAYLDRLVAFARGLDGETERLKRDASRGVIAPGFILDMVIAQQQAYCAKPLDQWGLVSSLARRATKSGIAGDWAAKAHQICEAEIAGAMARQIQALRNLRTTASMDAGVWKLAEGDAYYAWTLRAGTTTKSTAEEIHRIGLDQVSRLNDGIDRTLKANGFTKGTVGERLAALSKDPRQLYSDTDAGRTELLAYLNRMEQEVRSRLPHLFASRRKIDIEIKRVPPEIEAGAPFGYQIDGSIDGSRPAYYYINLENMANWPRFTLPTLCFHEGLPGHTWQGLYTRDLPLVRHLTSFNAYVEGWGLYAEQLADEAGMYEQDPLGRLGYLQSVQFRACRLVVDTGLHAKRWSREKAIGWLAENNGLPEDVARGEVDRYCVWPGQACGYAIGLTELQRLRAQTAHAMGSRFNLPRFHETVLRAGPVPLTLLDQIAG